MRTRSYLLFAFLPLLVGAIVAAQAPTNVLNPASDLAGKTLVTAEGNRSISGTFTYTVPVRFATGIASAPGVVSSTDQTTGLTLGLTSIGLSLGGTQRALFDASGLTIYGTNIVNSSGLIPAISSTYFASLSGANLTALNASNLSSGTVPTARLGSGAASSSTFLRGDSTWASATGSAVTYTATLAPVQNTTVETDVLHFDIPAGTMSDGDSVRIVVTALEKNNKGSSGVLIGKVNVGAGGQVDITNGGVTQADNASEFTTIRTFVLQREGSTVAVGASSSVADWLNSTASVKAGTGTSTPTNFTGANTVTLKITLAAADATFYYKPQSASVVHFRN